MTTSNILKKYTQRGDRAVVYKGTVPVSFFGASILQLWWVKSLFYVLIRRSARSYVSLVLFLTTASKTSQASLRQSVMYHLLFTWLMENAAGRALCALSVLSATCPSFTAPFRLIKTTNCSIWNISCVSWIGVIVFNLAATKNSWISFWFPGRCFFFFFF